MILLVRRSLRVHNFSSGENNLWRENGVNQGRKMTLVRTFLLNLQRKSFNNIFTLYGIISYFVILYLKAVAQLAETLRYKPEGRGFDFRWATLPVTLCPWIDSDSKRSEHQMYYLGVKAADAYGCQPCHLHVSIIWNSASLKLLKVWEDLYGPVKGSLAF